jgi:hypothetical protein
MLMDGSVPTNPRDATPTMVADWPLTVICLPQDVPCSAEAALPEAVANDDARCTASAEIVLSIKKGTPALHPDAQGAKVVGCHLCTGDSLCPPAGTDAELALAFGCDIRKDGVLVAQVAEVWVGGVIEILAASGAPDRDNAVGMADAGH